MSRRKLLLNAAVALLAVAVFAALLRNASQPPRSDEQPSRRESLQALIRQGLFAELRPVKLANCVLERLGEPHDGGYLVCGNLLQSVQAGYSYGISGYDQWGCDLSRRFNVTVHEYDCFDTRQPVCPGGALVFHAECVGEASSVEEGRPFDTLRNQITKNGDGSLRLVVKMDVEGAEWNSLLLAPDAVLDQIDQLVVEFHQVQEERFIAAVQRVKQFFHVAHVHFNNFSCDPSLKPFPSWAYEVLFVSKRLGVVDPAGTATGLSPEDAVNNPGAPDCQAAN